MFSIKTAWILIFSLVGSLHALAQDSTNSQTSIAGEEHWLWWVAGVIGIVLGFIGVYIRNQNLKKAKK